MLIVSRATRPPLRAVIAGNLSTLQVEELFQARQMAARAKLGGKAAKKMAVLDIKRATAIGVQAHSLR